MGWCWKEDQRVGTESEDWKTARSSIDSPVGVSFLFSALSISIRTGF